MKHIIHMITISTLLTLSPSIWAQDITGQWQSICDESGKAISVVELYIQDGKLYGKIVKILDINEDSTAVSSTIEDEQNLVGMVIIDGLSNTDNVWYKDKGIFYPEKDRRYDIKIWLQDQELMVRCYQGCLYRTQKWIRL